MSHIAIVCAAFAAALLIFAGVAHAAVGAPGPAPSSVAVDWGFWLAVGSAVLSGAVGVLHVLKARTHSKTIATLSDAVDKLHEMVGPLIPATGVPTSAAPAADNPAPGPALVKDSGAAMLAVLLFGALTAPALTGCHTAAGQQVASEGKAAATAVLDCERKLAPSQLEQGLVLLGTDIASMILAHGAIDWNALATAAIADASEVKTCAIAEYHAVMAATAPTPAAEAKLVQVNPPPVNALEAAIAKIKAARGVSVIATPGGPV